MTGRESELGVIFDWDGVVIDSRAQHEAAWNQLAGELGETLPEGFFGRIFGLRNPDAIAHHTSWAEPDDEDRVRVLAQRKEELYRASVREGGVGTVPGAVELFEVLAAAGIPFAVGSSAPRENIDHALESLQAEGRLEPRFAAIIAAGDVAHGKPHPEVFLRCGREIGRPPERCVVFEDAPAGVQAAKSGGMRAVGLTTTHPPDALGHADLVLPDLTAVGIETLQSLFA